MSWRLPTQLTVCTVISTVMLVLQLPLLISSQATPPSASCEQQVLAALRQQAAYNTNGYNLDLVWEPSFASSWNSFGCLNSLHSLRMTGAVPHLPSTWATNSSFLALEKLDFSSSQLTGTLPPEWGSLGGFPALLSLDFSRTGLTGALPAAWGSMNAFPKLVNLTLVDTSLLGSLPAAWGSQGGLRALHRLEIGSCDLVGALPPQWANASAFPTLVSLSLHDMFLTGSLPAEWGSAIAFQELQSLSISHTAVTGPIPDTWTSMGAFPTLQVLNISNSPLHTTLPAALGTEGVLPNLTVVHFENSSISGSIPLEWTLPNAFPKLQQLLLQNNSLSGSLPSSWSAALPSVTWLQLSNNPITGTIPSQWASAGQFSQLAQLTLDNTNISGTLPAAWGNATALPSLLYFSCMGCVDLMGTLPPSWGGAGVMSRLQFIGIRHSSISGALPDSWAAPGAFPSLRLMDLSVSALSGSIPPSWGSASAFPSLTAIYINQSRMSGAMPAFHNAKLSIIIADSCNLSGNLDDLWNSTAPLVAALMANNSISGFLPQNASAMPQLGYLDLDNNQLQGTVPLPWLEPGQVVSHLNQINLGNVWHQSEGDQNWRQGLCLRKDIYDANLAYENLVRVTGIVSGMIITPSYVQQLNSQWGNVFWMFQQFSSQLLSVTRICANSNAPTVLLAMWLAFAAIVIANLLLYEGFRLRSKRNSAFQPFWSRWWSRFRWVRVKETAAYIFEAVAPLLELTIYYYDLLAAVIVLKQVWGTWPGDVLLGIFLFHYALTGGIVIFHGITVFLDNWRFAPNPNKRFACHAFATVLLAPLMIPFVLFLDTLALVREIAIGFIKLAALPSCSRVKIEQVRAYFRHHTCVNLRITWVEMHGYEDMHNLIATFFQTVPTICLNSVLFALGNKPSHGLFFSQSLFISCMIAAYVAMLKTLILVLWAAYYHGQHVFIYAGNVMTGNFILRNPKQAKQTMESLGSGDRTSSTQLMMQQQLSSSHVPALHAMNREPSLDANSNLYISSAR